MTSAGKPSALLPVYTAATLPVQTPRLPALGPQAARAIPFAAGHGAVSGAGELTVRQTPGAEKETQPLARRRRAIDLNMAPACALRPEQQDYWRQLSTRKRQFATFKTQHADVLAPSKTDLVLPADIKEQREALTSLQKQRAMLAEREPWLHVYGLSQEGKEHPGARHQEYLHELLNRKLEKYLPREAFIDKLDLAVELSVTFLVETAPSDFFEISDRKNFSLRDVLTGDALRVMRRKLVASDRTPSIQALLLTDNRGVMKPEFLARMAQLAKEAFFNLHQELQTQLHEVTNDSEIENAYFTIAKNRLACTLLPLLEEKEQNAVATLARKWMDKEITE